MLRFSIVKQFIHSILTLMQNPNSLKSSIVEDDARYARRQKLLFRLLVGTSMAFIIWLIYFIHSYRLIVTTR